MRKILRVVSKKVIIGVFLFCILLIAGAAFLLSSDEKEINVVQYSIADEKRPIVEVQKMFVDFGKIKVADVKQENFAIKM